MCIRDSCTQAAGCAGHGRPRCRLDGVLAICLHDGVLQAEAVDEHGSGHHGELILGAHMEGTIHAAVGVVDRAARCACTLL
eukprot:1603733-Alexandrium_andersonii.AAC.1